jgi:endonuclease/exonuclease/phosphatase family metal-dependent hydrolase
LARWANVALILCTFLCYLAPYVSPSQFWPLAFFGLLYPWLLLGHVLFILFWLSIRHKYALLSLACIVLGWEHFRGLVGFHFGSASDAPQTISILTFNAHSMRYFQHRQAAVDVAELARIFNNKKTEIVCFQEFMGYPDWNPAYLNFLKKKQKLPNRVWDENNELAIFTSFPVLASKQKNFNYTNGYQYADLNVNGTVIRVFNIHLQSNAISSIADRMATTEDMEEEEALYEMRTMLGRFKRAAQKRAHQAAEVAAEIARSPYPVLVCGDLNDIPQSYTYRTLSAGLQDAFKEKGGGLGITYAGRIPGLRIDYILASPDFQILDYEKRRSSFSDHRPMASVVTLPNLMTPKSPD